MGIHETAIIEDGAQLGNGVSIGPWCHIGAAVRLGDNVKVHAHVVITGHTTIGADTEIFPFASLGTPPQHLGYQGEDTTLEIGRANIIREHVTMNIGTVQGGGRTIVGDHGLFMMASHVAHDCQIGDHVIFANNATLGGHVRVGNYAFLGGLCAVHQFCRIGDYAFVGGCAAMPNDLIPFGSAIGNHAYLAGLNVIGMKRRGLSRETITKLRNAYKLIFEGEGVFADRVLQAQAQYGDCPQVAMIIDFINEKSSRPIMTKEN